MSQKMTEQSEKLTQPTEEEFQAGMLAYLNAMRNWQERQDEALEMLVEKVNELSDTSDRVAKDLFERIWKLEAILVPLMGINKDDPLS